MGFYEDERIRRKNADFNQILPLEVGRFYKDNEDHTMLVVGMERHDGIEVYYAYWHEQMLGEPNHAAITFSKNGYLLKTPFLLDDKYEEIKDCYLTRQCTELETARYEKEIDEFNN